MPTAYPPMLIFYSRKYTTVKAFIDLSFFSFPLIPLASLIFV